MTKRTQHIDSEPNADEIEPIIPNPIVSGLVPAYQSTPLQRLINSDIIVAAEGAISWREGHLEHVARLYVADAAQAWRDYADDLTVALSADGGNFAALVERARNE